MSQIRNYGVFLTICLADGFSQFDELPGKASAAMLPNLSGS